MAEKLSFCPTHGHTPVNDKGGCIKCAQDARIKKTKDESKVTAGGGDHNGR